MRVHLRGEGPKRWSQNRTQKLSFRSFLVQTLNAFAGNNVILRFSERIATIKSISTQSEAL